MREHEIELRVRYDEVDAMGFVHHSNYLRYFEIGRTELLRASGGCYRDMEAAGQWVVVVHVDCRYRKPARYDYVITVRTRIDQWSRFDARVDLLPGGTQYPASLIESLLQSA